MDNELGRGLSKETNDAAEIKMLPSYVTSTPDGTGRKIICVKIESKLLILVY